MLYASIFHIMLPSSCCLCVGLYKSMTVGSSDLQQQHKQAKVKRRKKKRNVYQTIWPEASTDRHSSTQQVRFEKKQNAQLLQLKSVSIDFIGSPLRWWNVLGNIIKRQTRSCRCDVLTFFFFLLIFCSSSIRNLGSVYLCLILRLLVSGAHIRIWK